MSFTTLKSVLSGALRRAGIHSQMESFLICQEANKLIGEILLENDTKSAQAQYIKNRVLYVKVENPTVASELNLCKRDIIEPLAQKFGEGKVADMILRV